jgi:hypothetical protein
VHNTSNDATICEQQQQQQKFNHLYLEEKGKINSIRGKTKMKSHIPFKTEHDI